MEIVSYVMLANRPAFRRHQSTIPGVDESTNLAQPSREASRETACLLIGAAKW